MLQWLDVTCGVGGTTGAGEGRGRGAGTHSNVPGETECHSVCARRKHHVSWFSGAKSAAKERMHFSAVESAVTEDLKRFHRVYMARVRTQLPLCARPRQLRTLA